MPRTLSSPNAGTAASHIQPILLGGTGAASAPQALSNLGAIPLTKLGAPNGIAKLNASGTFDATAIPDGLSSGPMVYGLPSNYIGQVSTYQITNFDSATTYTVNAISGTVSRNGEMITYTAPGTVGNGGFTVNGKSFSIPIVAAGVATPSITSPVNGAINQSATVILTSSAFAVSGGSDTHLSSSWEVATDSSFNTIIASSMDNISAKTSWTVSGLLVNKTYYARCRHTGTVLGASAWSNVSNFSTRSFFIPDFEQAILTASDKAANDWFGFSVALSSDGSTCCVGSYQADPSSISNAGKAYIYVRSGSTWSQQAILTASDKMADGQFGIAVTLSSDGSTCCIGANYQTVGGVTYSGQAYIFTRTGTTWTEQAKLSASDKVASGGFGGAVALSSDGSTCCIGAIGQTSGGVTYVGQTYIFIRSGSTWSQQAILVADDKAQSDSFGWSVALSGDSNTCCVGSKGHDTGGDDGSGQAYIFTRTGTVWTEQAKLKASDKAASDAFGWAVSLNGDGNTCAISGLYHTTGGVNQSGQVYIYTRSGTTWTEQAKLSASDKQNDPKFGHSVSLNSDGNMCCIGAWGHDVDAIADTGQAYIFTRSGTVWAEQAKLKASDRMNSDQFGVYVALSADGSKAVIGARAADPSSISAAGKAYIFS